MINSVFIPNSSLMESQNFSIDTILEDQNIIFNRNPQSGFIPSRRIYKIKSHNDKIIIYQYKLFTISQKKLKDLIKKFTG